MKIYEASCCSWKIDINSWLLQFFRSFSERLSQRIFNYIFSTFLQSFIFDEAILNILWQYLFDKFWDKMPIDSMSITNSKKISVIHHKIFNKNKSVLIHFIFFINSKTFSIASGIFWDKIDLIVFCFVFIVFC